MKCPSCSHAFEGPAAKCPRCGEKLRPQMTFDSQPDKPSPQGASLLQKPLHIDRRGAPPAPAVPRAENVWSLAATPPPAPAPPVEPSPRQGTPDRMKSDQTQSPRQGTPDWMKSDQTQSFDVPLASDPPEPAALEPTVSELTLAPAWRRLVAWAVDGVLLGGVFALYCVAGLWAFGLTKLHGSREGGLDYLADTLVIYRALLVPGAILMLALGFAYVALFGALGGRSPGMRLAGIRVVRVNGAPLGVVRAVVRGVLALVSFLLGAAGLAWALVDRRGQALHDKLVRTVVVTG